MDPRFAPDDCGDGGTVDLELASQARLGGSVGCHAPKASYPFLGHYRQTMPLTARSALRVGTHAVALAGCEAIPGQRVRRVLFRSTDVQVVGSATCPDVTRMKNPSPAGNEAAIQHPGDAMATRRFALKPEVAVAVWESSAGPSPALVGFVQEALKSREIIHCAMVAGMNI